MVVEQIYNSFKSVFGDYMADRGLRWNGKCFIGHFGDMVTRVSVDYSVNRYNAKIDFRLLHIPICSINLVDLTTNLKWGVSINKLSVRHNVDLPDKYDYRKSTVDNVINEYFLYMKSFFDKIYDYSTLYECIEKISLGSSNTLDIIKYELTLKYYSILNLDLVSIVYMYYKSVGVEKSQPVIMGILQIFRSFLYDKMKFGNITELSDMYSEKEIRILYKVFENYERFTHFAEAVLQNNDVFLDEIEKRQIKNECECKDYLSKL